MNARPKNWKPMSMTIRLAHQVKGRVIDVEGELPLLADGSVYREMLDKRLDELKHTLWAQVEREKAGS